MRFGLCFMGIVLLTACAAPTGRGGAGGQGGQGGGGGCPNDLPTTCPADAPGYAATIAPLMATWCVSCHGPGGDSSEKPLGTWADVSARKGSVLTQVYACKMPQPPATLPSKERGELLAWLVCGAPDD